MLFTEIDDIENLGGHVLRDCGEQLAIFASGNRDYRSEVGTVVFHEFDAMFLLFPELEMTIYRCRDEKTGPEGQRMRSGCTSINELTLSLYRNLSRPGA